MELLHNMQLPVFKLVEKPNEYFMSVTIERTGEV